MVHIDIQARRIPNGQDIAQRHRWPGVSLRALRPHIAARNGKIEHGSGGRARVDDRRIAARCARGGRARRNGRGGACIALISLWPLRPRVAPWDRKIKHRCRTGARVDDGGVRTGQSRCCCAHGDRGRRTWRARVASRSLWPRNFGQRNKVNPIDFSHITILNVGAVVPDLYFSAAGRVARRIDLSRHGVRVARRHKSDLKTQFTSDVSLHAATFERYCRGRGGGGYDCRKRHAVNGRLTGHV